MNTNIDQLRALTPCLRCPVCSSAFAWSANHLLCAQGHGFDRARQGYVNLLNRPASTKYDKTLFSSRRFVWQDGLWHPLLDLVSRLIFEEIGGTESRQTLLLDAGCGEGSLLYGVWDRIGQMGLESNAVGLDNVKDALRMAASANPQLAWCVADLARVPIEDGAVDVVLNVLSPANYTEFFRLLKSGGIVVKVVPNQDYLRELRSALSSNGMKRQSKVDLVAEDCTVQLFRSRVSAVRAFRLRYQHKFEAATAKHLIRMTPLNWHMDPVDVEMVLNRLAPTVTVDLNVLVGRKP